MADEVNDFFTNKAHEDEDELQGELDALMDDAKAEEELAAMENIVIPGGNINAGPQVVPQQPAEEAK